MIKKYRVFSLFFVGLFVAACGSKPEQSVSEVTDPFLKSQLVVGGEVNQFKVRLNWKPVEKVTQWQIQKFEKDLGIPTEQKKYFSDVTEHEDTAVIPGEKYTYTVSSFPEGVLLGTTEVVILKDVEANSVDDLISKGPIHRLFLRKDKVITTFGQDIDLRVKFLIAEDGLIQTFAPQNMAPIGENGRHGGSIKIHAEVATGNLTIVGRGENGGNGKDGNTGAPGNPGANGKAGRWGLIDKAKHTQDWFRKSLLEQPDKFPNWGPDHPRWDGWYNCAEAPSNGGKGEQGGAGEDGGRGGKGGNKANVQVVAQEQRGFSVAVEAMPGLGGLGGRGGIGGPGGVGGNPGARDRLHRCPAANPGPEGDVGIAGRPGNPGQDGQ